MSERFQKRVVFWLDLNDPAQGEMYDFLEDELKAERKFHWFIRTAIVILRGLLRRDIGPLIEQFPWIIEEVLQRYALDAETIDALKVLARLGPARLADGPVRRELPPPPPKPVMVGATVDDGDDDSATNFLQSFGF